MPQFQRLLKIQHRLCGARSPQIPSGRAYRRGAPHGTEREVWKPVSNRNGAWTRRDCGCRKL